MDVYVVEIMDVNYDVYALCNALWMFCCDF